MTGKRAAVTLVSFLVLSAACLAQGFAPRPPIAIRSDADLTPENGVVGGRGTPDDPYVIAGWEIDAGEGVGILLKGIDAHVVIEGCLIRGGPRGTGLSIAGSSRVTVQGCRFEGLGTGIFLYESPGARLIRNEFSGCWTGIQGNASPSLLIRGNLFRDARKYGLFLWRARGSVLEDNRAFGCGAGIYLDSCNGLTVAGNLVQECGWGIYLWDSHSCVLTRNAVAGCERGLGLYHTSSGNLLYHNAFLDCPLPAFDDSSGENRWFAPYPRGGNFWAGVGLEDRYSGSGQDEPGPDGIGDTPVRIPEVGLDRYPLMELPLGLPALEKGEEE
ncbi:MAG: hypothetical protein GXO72_02810 [Caldiserica bacterium]|nr:hypothetical protein [Caldisericota bacterium]